MRQPSNADAEHAEDAGEFPGTPVYARSSAAGCATRVRANAKRNRASENYPANNPGERPRTPPASTSNIEPASGSLERSKSTAAEVTNIRSNSGPAKVT